MVTPFLFLLWHPAKHAEKYEVPVESQTGNNLSATQEQLALQVLSIFNLQHNIYKIVLFLSNTKSSKHLTTYRTYYAYSMGCQDCLYIDTWAINWIDYMFQ